MEKIPTPPVLTLDPNDDNIILEIPEDKDPNEKSAEPVKKEKVGLMLRTSQRFTVIAKKLGLMWRASK
jgi:transcription initiation factor TFIID subunit 1